jgi:hypothetical protein
MSSNELPGQLVRTHSDSRRYKYLRISSKERPIGDEPYNFECAFGPDIRLDHMVDLHLHSVSIPNIGNNISLDIGNSSLFIDFTIAGIQTFVIPNGYYSTASLMNSLTTQINAIIAPSIITIAQDPVTNLISFTITAGPETFQILGILGGSTLAPYIGIYNNSAPAITTYTTTSIPNLYGSTYYYIHSSDIGSNLTYVLSNNGQVNDVNGMFSIPVNTPYGAMQTYLADNENDQIVFGQSAQSLRRFRITIRTNGGRLLTELPTNSEVVIILKAFWGQGLH